MQALHRLASARVAKASWSEAWPEVFRRDCPCNSLSWDSQTNQQWGLVASNSVIEWWDRAVTTDGGGIEWWQGEGGTDGMSGTSGTRGMVGTVAAGHERAIRGALSESSHAFAGTENLPHAFLTPFCCSILSL